MVGRTLTASDPEPPPGTLVRDDCGVEWVNDGHRPCCWVQPEAEVHDPETWTKVAGNYGPVVVIGRGDEPDPDAPRWCPCGHWTGGDFQCLNGRIYGPCGHENCTGACDDTLGRCGTDGCLCEE